MWSTPGQLTPLSITGGSRQQWALGTDILLCFALPCQGQYKLNCENHRADSKRSSAGKSI